MFCDGLVVFQQLEVMAARPPALTWPKLSISGDQGSDVLSAVNALQRKFKLNLDYIPDTNHGVHNDIWAAARNTGLSSFFYLMLLTLNIPMGPWSEDARYKQVKQALASFFRDEVPGGSPLFQFSVGRLAEELQKDSGPMSDEQVWDALAFSNPWENKGTKIVRSRFLGVITAGRAFCSEWHRRCFGYSFASLELGFMSNMKPAKLNMKDKPAEKETTNANRESSEEQALRKACGNQMQMGAIFLMADANLTTLKLVCECTLPIETWFHAQNVDLRSVEGTLTWVTAQVAGGFFKPLVDVFGCFLPASLSAIGLRLPHNADKKRLDQFQNLVLAEELFGERLGDFAMSLVGHRLLRCQWLLSGWTTRDTLFLHEEHARVEAAVKELKQDWAIYLRMEANHAKHPGIKPIAERSLFRLVLYEQLVALFRDTDWKATAEVKEFVRSSNRRLLASQLAEDGFNRQKMRRSIRIVVAMSRLLSLH